MRPQQPPLRTGQLIGLPARHPQPHLFFAKKMDPVISGLIYMPQVVGLGVGLWPNCAVIRVGPDERDDWKRWFGQRGV